MFRFTVREFVHYLRNLTGAVTVKEKHEGKIWEILLYIIFKSDSIGVCKSSFTFLSTVNHTI